MLVRLKEDMKFKSIYADDEDNNFVVKKYDYYGDGEEIWCAFTDSLIYPLAEIYLDDYMPFVNGKWINEKNEYID